MKLSFQFGSMSPLLAVTRNSGMLSLVVAPLLGVLTSQVSIEAEWGGEENEMSENLKWPT